MKRKMESGYGVEKNLNGHISAFHTDIGEQFVFTSIALVVKELFHINFVDNNKSEVITLEKSILKDNKVYIDSYGNVRRLNGEHVTFYGYNMDYKMLYVYMVLREYDI